MLLLYLTHFQQNAEVHKILLYWLRIMKHKGHLIKLLEITDILESNA